MTEIRIPNLEGAQDVGIVEIYVRVGDAVEKETPLVSLESDKAVMDVPSPLAGTITEIRVSEGDTVNSGDLLALLDPDDPDEEPKQTVKGNTVSGETKLEEGAAEQSSSQEKPPSPAASPHLEPGEAPEADLDPEKVNAQEMRAKYHATPSVRALARELGVSLTQIRGTGPKGRITREDISSLVKRVMSETLDAAKTARGFTLPPIPSANYSAFGEIEADELSRIKRISGPNLHRNWIGIPHITQFDKVDITELEAFRKKLNTELAKDRKISPLIFIIKATVQALKTFLDFNSSLSSDGKRIIRKKYINIGVAVDTPGGLLVPVIRNVNNLGILELTERLADLSRRAREGKLKADEMSGGTFTISSLGGIGGTNFTPIINAPEVAILGISKSEMRPVWNGSSFDARLVLPFSLSYDHRIIDGAYAVRFTSHLSSLIGDMRRILL